MCKQAVIFLVLLALDADVWAVTIDWVPVGNPGNAADTVTPNPGYGAVGYAYNIDKYDVTNNQYVEFLNAKDPTGANKLGLFDIQMSNRLTGGGVSFSNGNASGSKYSVIAGTGVIVKCCGRELV